MKLRVTPEITRNATNSKIIINSNWGQVASDLKPLFFSTYFRLRLYKIEYRKHFDRFYVPQAIQPSAQNSK